MKHKTNHIVAWLSMLLLAVLFAPNLVHAADSLPGQTIYQPPVVSLGDATIGVGQQATINPSGIVVSETPVDLPRPTLIEDFAYSVIAKLALKYPWIASIIAAMGFARVFAKPICSIIHAVVDLTPTKKDDGFLAWFTTPTGKKVAYALDWALSIKIVPPAKAVI